MAADCRSSCGSVYRIHRQVRGVDWCHRSRRKCTSASFPARLSALERRFLLRRLVSLALFLCLDSRFRGGSAVAEPIGLVARFHDVAMMRQTMRQRCRHLHVHQHIGPQTEGQVRRDHDAGVFVELGQNVKQHRAASVKWRLASSVIRLRLTLDCPKSTPVRSRCTGNLAACIG